MAHRQMTTSQFQGWIEAFRKASPEVQREALKILLEIHMHQGAADKAT
jgi:hypothetical protein